jgi:hypothetical protein
MPSAGFDPAILAAKPIKTYALERTATGIGAAVDSVTQTFLFSRLTLRL